ncbi:MAG TPA: hypothetical protein VM597_00100 [Gemmataceae bacterium]|nr:hypothetical protein [Gemmataceae bacterium]
MFSPENVILTLKALVAAVTVLFACSIAALVAKRPRLHGRLNTVFFVLTLVPVIGFEVVIRFVTPNLTDGFSPAQRSALAVHLGFSVPSAVMLPAMLYTGKRRLLRYHVPFACVFTVLWAGTFVTGIFFLPHSFGPLP